MNENQPLETKRPEPAPSATPKRFPINIPPWALFASYAVLFVLAVIAGYAYNDARGVHRVPNYQPDVPAQPDPVPPAPDPVPAEPGTRPVVRDGATLTLEWTGKFQDKELDFLGRNDDPEINEYYKADYYQAARVVSEGPYKNFLYYVVSVPCDGPCRWPPFYRFLYGIDPQTPNAERIYLLGRYSPKDIDWIPGDFTVLSDIRIPELEIPQTFKGPQGQKLDLVEWRNIWFDLSNRQFAFHDERLGDVFSSDDGGFYVRAADGSEALYRVLVPFAEDTTVPRVTWNDGTANTYDYSFMDYGGCGHLNVTSVFEDDVQLARDLAPGGRASNGDTIYFFRDPHHPFMQGVYDAGYGVSDYETGEKMSYQEFIASKPVFVWKDPFGRLIKFQRTSFQLQAECGKPVIYLYPEKTTEVSVRVEPKGGMTVSDPPYEGGWKVVAEPDGTLKNLKDNSAYPYLFWEGRGGLYETPKQGHVVAREDVPTFIGAQLRAHGLNDKEIADFTEFWLPRMRAKPYYFVTFLTTQAMNEIAPLTIEPKPETVFRILMDYLPLDAPITVPPPPKPRPVVRNGFTVIEWGGVLGRE